MWNPFKKLKKTSSDFAVNMASRVAMKKMAKMNSKEQQSMMAEVMNPKNRDKMLQVMEMMKKSGQITEEQYNIAKQKLGL